MTVADALPVTVRRVTSDGRRPGPALQRLLAVLAGRPVDGDELADPARFVCPFCGRGYDAARRRCASCDALPVVPREDRHVYRAVLGPCGARCAPRAEPALHAPR